ncbi:MAG: tRNA 2-thiouridine(34) synthase MnmA [Bacteroidetes bacterium]|jgi:tRNA-specific 2-thiouridylase|nr:tRNA 2-thiouridine(34) synthase MnmA [Bacteroidota bacterium]
MKRAVVGLSGGVDSSVAACLLKQQDYDVIALFMINWHDTTGTLEGDCPWNDDLIFAELVARKLDIPFHTVDLSDQYRNRVVDYMFSEYEKGRTPNPDVLCNREIKFDEFFAAAEKYDADFVATGHYCQKDTMADNGQIRYRLMAGIDRTKDQSYFLCQLNQHQLSKALFPIGHLWKKEVRKIAQEQALPTATKKDSQGICFVGKVDLPTFLQQKLAPRRGKIIEIEKDHALYQNGHQYESVHEYAQPFHYSPNDGKEVGEHSGAHYFTIGQRKGLNVGGKQEPLFVIATDIEKNVIYTGQGHDHPGLNRKALFIPQHEIHWVRPDQALDNGQQGRYEVRIRYRQPLQKAELVKEDTGLYILFDSPQRGITPGQFAAWYREGELIGSGVING